MVIEFLRNHHVHGRLAAGHVEEYEPAEGVRAYSVRTGRASLEVDGDSSAYVFWPNREGERFSVVSANERLAGLNRHNSGLILTYPATASTRAFIIGASSEGGCLFCAPPDESGVVTRITVRAPQQGRILLSVEGPATTWYCLPFKEGPLAVRSRFQRLAAQLEWPLLPERRLPFTSQVQLGFIDPGGISRVPRSKGFAIIDDVSDTLVERLGPGVILHLFAYGKGHDIGYPDYEPAPSLGGADSLSRALERCRAGGLIPVMYLNGRLACEDALEENPSLREGVFLTPEGDPVVERYHDRSFYVMDPSSALWTDCLFECARRLKHLGAMGVQLDQLGGRPALALPGHAWGTGYKNLIDRIHDELGLYVWIQGVSDLYDADWFEMTWRPVRVREDGTLLGGNPLGGPGAELAAILLGQRTFLVPKQKVGYLPDEAEFAVIIDELGDYGALPIYGKAYHRALRAL